MLKAFRIFLYKKTIITKNIKGKEDEI